MSASVLTTPSMKAQRAQAPAALRLVGARVAVDPTTAIVADVEISAGGYIRSVSPVEARPRRTGRRQAAADVDLSGCMILPGLINAHDHLEFGLFPRLGRGPYPNAEAWAKDIFQPGESPLAEHLEVPKPVRYWWGALRNLLCGVTTVGHHNPYAPEVFDDGFPIRVVRRYGWAHSLAFTPQVEESFAATPEGAPFIVHLAEGTDERSRNEIFQLDTLGALGPQTVIVHGVGLDREGIALLNERRATLIWCPTSNLFTLGKTLDPTTMSRIPRIALGSDSALTSQGDLLDEIRAACAIPGVGPERVYSMVTRQAARILRLRDGEGTVRVGAHADLVAIKDDGSAPAQALAKASVDTVELTMLGVEPKLLSPAMADRWRDLPTKGLERLVIEGTKRWVHAPVQQLMADARRSLGNEIRLAGKRVEA